MESALKLNLDFTLLNDHKDPFQVHDDTLSLQQIIPRLIHEKGQGSFLNITEDELIQEIQKAHDHRGDESIEENQGEFTEIAGGETQQEEEGQVAEETETQEQAQAEEEEAQNTGTNSTLSTNELFYKNKHEVLKNIQTALNESSLALDFVSLLISCLRPAAATVSMSAHLKKFVEHGSLNSDRVQDTKTAQMKQEQMKETRRIGLGWKLAALENASGLLRDAGSRLAEEVFKEKIFWDTIKKNLNTKEILFKTRERGTNKRVLAVKFGYSDSGSTYPIEGNAMIKTSNDNSNTVQFVPMDNRPIFNKSIRVRILARDSSSNADDSDYQIVGESRVSQEMFDAGSSEEDGSGYVSLKMQIEQARYLIFEEELFNQLVEESNSLISYNVRLESESKLTIEVNHQLIEITYQENLPSSELEKEPKPQDQRAELIATYLRLMLTMKHEAYLNAKNQTRILTPNPNSRQTQIQLQQQQQQQAQLQAQQQTKKEQTILKPIIGQFRHDFILRKLHTLITRVVSELNQSSSSSSNQPIKFLLNRSKYISTSPPISRFKIIIPSRIKSRIFVNLDSFDWTNYLIKVIVCQEGERDQEFVFEDLRSGDIGGGVEGCLEWLISGLI